MAAAQLPSRCSGETLAGHGHRSVAPGYVRGRRERERERERESRAERRARARHLWVRNWLLFINPMDAY